MEMVTTTERPVKSFIKAIPAKVHVVVFNSITGQKEGVILKGNPRNASERESCIIDLSTDTEYRFFVRNNVRHLEVGNIIPYEREDGNLEISLNPLNSLSDKEMMDLLNGKFLALKNAVDKMDSVAPVNRLIQLAREAEKSEKYIAFLETKLSDIQEQEFNRED